MKYKHLDINDGADATVLFLARRPPELFPDLEPDGRYALKDKATGKLVAKGTLWPPNLTEKPEDARIFAGDYLNRTGWDWLRWMEAVTP